MKNKRLKKEIKDTFYSARTKKEIEYSTGHFQNEDAEYALESIEEALSDAIYSELDPFIVAAPNKTIVEKNRAVAACNILNLYTQGRGNKFRLNIDDRELLLAAVQTLEELIKDEKWLGNWGNQIEVKKQKLEKLRRALLKKWNDAE